ncbi:DUF6966 domain-containing protein [Pseudomonas chlororaphis]|uniref:DUF6966 domain-containing protein n=1 Tax=Pseudomonas chlororaphis TaxID=587753 RepID=UPI003D108760
MPLPDSPATRAGFIRREGAQALLLDSDYSGITCLLSAYGGMGSFNALILRQTFANGCLFLETGPSRVKRQIQRVAQPGCSARCRNKTLTVAVVREQHLPGHIEDSICLRDQALGTLPRLYLCSWS